MKGLYIHIPFCVKKCKYCDFNSFSATEEDKSRYLEALFREMERYRGEAVDSIFIGGGTPTSLGAQDLRTLLRRVNEVFEVDKTCEFTVEANPKTLDGEKLAVMRENGVNRLSVGVQSFNSRELCALGRIHSAEDAENTVRLARECGFENISIDLMCAVPHQTAESFRENLERAFRLHPEHISCYSLILEENTPLFEEYEKGELPLPSEDEEREIYEIACRELEAHGYGQYEISNFAKPGFRSRHNIKYWQCAEYIGLGLSAHSYLDGVRFSNTADFSEYIKGNFSGGEREILSKADKMSEFMFMGLRMTDGVSKEEFSRRFGRDIREVFASPIEKFLKMGMIEEKDGFIRLAHKAIGVSNQIMCEFII